MGKSEGQIKQRVKETPKSPISLFWVGTSAPLSLPLRMIKLTRLCTVLLGFIIFGGLVFEAISRFFG